MSQGRGGCAGGAGRAHDRCQQVRTASFQGQVQVRLMLGNRARCGGASRASIFQALIGRLADPGSVVRRLCHLARAVSRSQTSYWRDPSPMARLPDDYEILPWPGGPVGAAAREEASRCRVRLSQAEQRYSSVLIGGLVGFALSYQQESS